MPVTNERDDRVAQKIEHGKKGHDTDLIHLGSGAYAAPKD